MGKEVGQEEMAVIWLPIYARPDRPDVHIFGDTVKTGASQVNAQQPSAVL